MQNNTPQEQALQQDRNKRIKVLMFGNDFVDPNLLHRGIYTCAKPFIYDADITMENHIQSVKELEHIAPECINSNYYENLQRCSFIDAEIHFPATPAPLHEQVQQKIAK
jgi:hypothetical protein